MKLVRTDDDVWIGVDDPIGDDADRDVGHWEKHRHVGDREERERSACMLNILFRLLDSSLLQGDVLRYEERNRQGGQHRGELVLGRGDGEVRGQFSKSSFQDFRTVKNKQVIASQDYQEEQKSPVGSEEGQNEDDDERSRHVVGQDVSQTLKKTLHSKSLPCFTDNGKDGPDI